MRTSQVVVAAALLTSGIAACSVGPASGPATPAGSPPAPSPGATSSGATSSGATSSSDARPAPTAAVAPTVTGASADGHGFGLLKDVRLARQEGGDRRASSWTWFGRRDRAQRNTTHTLTCLTLRRRRSRRPAERRRATVDRLRPG